MSEKKSGKKPLGKSPAVVKAKGTVASGPMNVDLLQQLVSLMAANDLNTVDLRDGDKRVILRRGAAPVVSYSVPAHPSPAPQSVSSGSTPAPAKAPTDDTAGLVAIKSPMVGTFYSRPNPESKAFVAVGAEVDTESDVCIIEAMKTFNTIKAEVRGTIAKLCVTDGQTVDVGKPLFLVKPS